VPLDFFLDFITHALERCNNKSINAGIKCKPFLVSEKVNIILSLTKKT
jgi:hypothetical protein